MGFHNRVMNLRDVLEWTDTDPLPEGATITVEGGQFVLVPPEVEGRIDARYPDSVNPDVVDAGSPSTTNADVIDGGTV